MSLVGHFEDHRTIAVNNDNLSFLLQRYSVIAFSLVRGPRGVEQKQRWQVCLVSDCSTECFQDHFIRYEAC